GTVDGEGYVVIRFAGKGYKAHRLAWLHHYGCWPAGPIDHINRLPGDNRIENLRDAGLVVNAHNVVKTRARSGERGVSWFSQYRKWKACIQVKGVKHFLGQFDTVEEAKAAYTAARAELGLPPLTP